jgi:squalene-hopene/tetraprenyl-beta-curcumene cyclase
VSISQTRDAFVETRAALMSARVEGHWVGKLSASALSTATAISAYSFYLQRAELSADDRRTLEYQIAAGIHWICNQQNDDGGWGDTDLSHSNISTTMLVVAALTAAGRAGEFASQIARARSCIDSAGGIAGLRARYGKDKTFAVPILANCAMAGIVSWREVAALPFEAACVPQRYYNLMQLPVVSYAIPALVAIGQAKFVYDPPWDPFRKLIRQAAVQRSLAVLHKMQPSTGGFLEAAPLTSFVAMGLIHAGHVDHPVVKSCLRFLVNSFREEDSAAGIEPSGSWPIDTDLATWMTTLSINALANDPDGFERDGEFWQPCLEWLLACQNTTVHPFTGAAPGGWGWSDLSGAVPDADDTPGALIALHHLLHLVEFDDSVKSRIRKAAHAGLEWLLNLQNRDQGWPTFCRGWGKLPFDRSGLDITAHAIRAIHLWRNEFPSARLTKAIKTGRGFLDRGQRKDGSWLPLWFGNQDLPDDVNPCYGTAKVLAAYRDTGSFDTPAAKIGLRWLCEHQNPDGGWGGGVSVLWNDSRLGASSVEETALCTELLLDHHEPPSRAAADRGLEWLGTAVETGNLQRPTPIGFYFAKLWYYEQLYPLVFATAALAKAYTRENQSTIGRSGEQQ